MMKKLFTLSVLAFFTLPLFPQKTDKQYLQEAPQIPAGVCSMNRDDVYALTEKIKILTETVKTEREEYNNEIEAFVKSNENNIQAKYATQSGISQEDMKKLQSGKMTEAEKKAMADKMMQQQLNMSMGEAKNVSNMSKEGKEAWATAYGAEQAANAQANPSSGKVDQMNARKMLELTNMQRHLNDSLTAVQTEFANRFNSVENDPAIKASKDSIEVWSAKSVSMMGIVSEQEARYLDGLNKKICDERQKLCNMYSNKYNVVLKDYHAFAKSSFNAYERLEKVNFDLLELQTGLKYPYKPGKAGLLSVMTYLERFEASLSCHNPCTTN